MGKWARSRTRARARRSSQSPGCSSRSQAAAGHSRWRGLAHQIDKCRDDVEGAGTALLTRLASGAGNPRVWEGAQLIHGSLVRRALDAGIYFSFVKETLLDWQRKEFEAEVGAPIGISDFGKPDTMDEFGLHCAPVAKTSIEFDVRAAHLRGPEVLHRWFPEIYRGATRQALAEVQQQVQYMDALLAVAMYYIAGLWDEIDHLDWTGARPEGASQADGADRPPG